MKQNPITRRAFALSFIAITAILATPALWASDTLVAGQAGGVGLYFNGARQHAKFACPMIPGREAGLTIEFWMRADRSTATVAGRQSIMALCGSTLVIQVEGINGENRLGLSGDGVDARSLAVLPDAQLHFVSVTCAPTELQLFVDGALKNTTKLARPLVFKGGDCIIGGFKGSVGPVTLWRGARIAAQVARDMLDFNTIESPCLTGKEPDLIAQFPLNEGAGPAQHKEFLLQYQMPIMTRFGLVDYGCCETLDNKIEILRGIPNLRRILMGPRANLKKGCEQIGADYIVSWRPNPAMVSSGFDEEHIRKILRQGLQDSRGCHIEIMLKEMMTVQGDLSRLFRWTEIARQEAEAAGA